MKKFSRLVVLVLLTLQSAFASAESPTWDAAAVAECTKDIKQVQLDATKERIRLLKDYPAIKQNRPIPEISLIRKDLDKLLTPERRARMEALRTKLSKQGWNDELKEQLSGEFEQILAPINQKFGSLECPNSPKPKKGDAPLRPLTEFSREAAYGLLASDAKTQAEFEGRVANMSGSLPEAAMTCPSTPGMRSNEVLIARRARRVTAIYNPVTQRFEVLIQTLDRSVQSEVIAWSDVLFTSSFDLLDSKSPVMGETLASALNHPYISPEFYGGNAIVKGDIDTVIEGLDKHGMLGSLKCGTFYKLHILGGSKGASSGSGEDVSKVSDGNSQKELPKDSVESEQSGDSSAKSDKRIPR